MTLNTNATPETVWKLLQETDRIVKETAAQMKETDKKFQETERLMREQSKETDKKFQETAAQMKETDKKIEKNARQQEKTDQQIKALNEQMGGLHRSFGQLAEHLVAPGIAEKFNALGYHFDSIAPGGKKILDEQGNALAQIDLLLENGEYTVAVEVKSKPNEDDSTKHVTRLEILRRYMEKHHDGRIIRGAIAGAIFPEHAKRAATEAGLYVIVQSGDTMQIELPKGFTPREW
jgi:hypothetical protein